MLPKMEKEKLFTIIYTSILICANFCKFLSIFVNANVAYNGKSWVPLGNIGKNEPPPPPPIITNLSAT